MREQKVHATWVLVAATILGILGDWIFRAPTLGVGVSIWFVSLLVALVLVSERESTKSALGQWIWLPLLLAISLAWRSSPSLRAWNLLGLLAALGFLAFPAIGICLRKSGVWEYCANAVAAFFRAVIGPAQLFAVETERDQESHPGTLRTIKAVMRGCLLAIPLILIFSALLMSADPVFDGVVHAAFDWDFPTIVSHVLLIGFLAWVAAGYLWSIVRESKPKQRKGTESTLMRLGIVEIGIGLGVLILLFLVFVVIQIEYLFGGEGVIKSTVGLNYAEYARGGFFQLLTVAALVVPVLLASHAMIVKENELDLQSYRALATVVLILVALIMASAVQRMLLYTDAYGLTHDRLYAIVFMAWVGTVLGLFTGIHLFGNGRSFVLAAILSGFGFLGATNVMNPDAVIARANFSRAEAGQPLDTAHMSRLSDAVPVFLERLPALDRQVRCELLHQTSRRIDEFEFDWRSWNLGLHRMMIAARSDRFEFYLRQCNLQVPQPGNPQAP